MSEQKPANYFDIASGTLLIGQAAFDAHIEAGGHPADVVSLPDYLAGHVEVEPVVDIPKTRKSDWDSNLDVPYAQWLHAETMQADPPGRITEEVVRRAAKLGLGASYKHLKSLPGGLTSLYQKAELQGVKTHRLFDSWTTTDWVNYVAKLGESLQRKPTYVDINEASALPGNPSWTLMKKHGVRLSEVNEKAGWVDVRDWDQDKFIDWGVKFMLANDGHKPTAVLMRILSKKGYGFSPSTIFKGDFFDGLVDYQNQVEAAYDQLVEGKQLADAMREAEYETALESDPFFKKLMSAGATEDRKIQTHARYMLSIQLVPDISDEQLRQICKTYSGIAFVRQLQIADPTLTAQQIEEMAKSSYLYDIIWPDTGFLERMRVIDEQD